MDHSAHHYGLEDLERVAFLNEGIVVVFLADDSVAVCQIVNDDIELLSHFDPNELGENHPLIPWLLGVFLFVSEPAENLCGPDCPCRNVTEYDIRSAYPSVHTN